MNSLSIVVSSVTISVGDRLRYRDDANGIFFNGQILTTTQNVIIQQPGTGFKVGDLYNIKNFDGYGSILKVFKCYTNGWYRFRRIH